MFFAAARAPASTPLASSARTRYQRPASMPRAMNPRSTRSTRAKMTAKAPRLLPILLPRVFKTVFLFSFMMPP